MIALSELIANAEEQIPALQPGETHCLVVQHYLWREQLTEQFAWQQPTLLLANPDDIERVRRHSADVSHHAQLTLAEWKFSKKFKVNHACRDIMRAGKSQAVIVLHIDMSEHNARQQALTSNALLAELKEWCRQQHKVLVIMLKGDLQQSAVTRYLTQTSGQFTSLQAISQGQPDWRWSVLYWFQGYIITRWEWDLREQPLPSGGRRFERVSSHADEPTSSRQGERAPRLFSRTAVRDSDYLPAEWQWLEPNQDIRGQLPAVADSVVVLGLRSHQNLKSIARQVFELRRYAGPYLRILVRELDDSLRLQDERFLINAGATLVLPAELSTRKVISLAETTVGFRFHQSLPETFTELEQRTQPVDFRGYLPPAQFIEQVLELDRKAEKLGLDTVLVRAETGTGLTPVSLIRRFSSRRPGDIISSLGGYIFIFLYGCRETDLGAVLKKNFGIPAENLFRQHTHYTAHIQITDLAEELAEAEQMHPSEDLTSYLFRQQPGNMADTRDNQTAPSGVRKASYL